MSRARLALLAVALLVATLAAYRPAWHGGMLWDDDAHVTRAELRSVQGLKRIWLEPGATQQYYPLAHTAFWLQHRVWGDDTRGYHLVNIVLHALSAFLLALVLIRLGVPWPWLAALVFALHPVHVESVAWITELKNTLSGALYLAAALAYLRFDRRREPRFYAVAAILFVLAVLAKSVTATLPAALLVVFWWQRGGLKARRDVLPLVPLLALGAGAGLFTAWAERSLVGAHGAAFQFTLAERILIAGRAIWFYLGKLAWPADLAFIYPRWEIGHASWWQSVFPLAAVALVAAAWLARRRSRAPLAALLFFAGTLVPALGFFNVFPFRYSFVADHFQYLASIGPIALACGAIGACVRRTKAEQARLLRRRMVTAAALGVVAVLAGLTWNQSAQYADAETLYRATIQRNPSCWMAHNNLGFLQLATSIDEAAAQFREALRLNPDYPEAHDNLGYALQMTGRPGEAVAEHEAALKLEPAYAEARNNLGTALERTGRLAEAAAQYEQAVKLRPEFVAARVNLGNALVRMGRASEAIPHLEQAVRQAPDLVEARAGLAGALAEAGRLDEAVRQYDEATRLDPGSGANHLALGDLLYRLGRFEDAIGEYSRALRLAPDSAEAHNNLGAALERTGRLDEAIAEYQQTVQLRPDSADARTNLARAAAARGRTR